MADPKKEAHTPLYADKNSYQAPLGQEQHAQLLQLLRNTMLFSLSNWNAVFLFYVSFVVAGGCLHRSGLVF